MSPADNNTNVHGPSGSGPGTPPDAADQLAHELANLLDGSLRHLGIVINTLRDRGQSGADYRLEDAGSEALLDRLQTTDRAMRQMVSLIHAWMRKASGPMELFDRAQTLGHMLDEAVHLHGPAANRYGIELSLAVEDEAARLTAGPVFPIVANAIRNAIEAISETPAPQRPAAYLIEVRAGVVDNELRLSVTDNGPGLDPSLVATDGTVKPDVSTKGAGHGLGLTLCRQIARSLDGALELINREAGGAQLTLCCPVASLTSPLPKSDHA